MLCDHIISELADVISRKRPDLIADMDVLLAQLPYETVIAPRDPSKLIDDPKDAPILNAAIQYEIDIIISGDNHFLSLDLERPRVMKPARFMEEVRD